MPERSHHYQFSLRISARDMARYYQGEAQEVSVLADNGQRLRFAARHLRPFITAEGIQGRFRLTTDENHRFNSLEKIQPL